MENNKEKFISDDYIVEIKGAVNNPGIYSLKQGSRVNDVIVLAGGFLDDASTDYINLSKKITDEMVIKVYTKEEIEKSNKIEVITKYVERDCNCPNIKNDACINNLSDNTSENSFNINNNIDDNNDIESNNSMININLCSKEQLMTIPGIGETKAIKIIEYREENGKFNKIEDLMNVSGIGINIYEKIKEYIEV